MYRFLYRTPGRCFKVIFWASLVYIGEPLSIGAQRYPDIYIHLDGIKGEGGKHNTLRMEYKKVGFRAGGSMPQVAPTAAPTLIIYTPVTQPSRLFPQLHFLPSLCGLASYLQAWFGPDTTQKHCTRISAKAKAKAKATTLNNTNNTNNTNNNSSCRLGTQHLLRCIP